MRKFAIIQGVKNLRRPYLACALVALLFCCAPPSARSTGRAPALVPAQISDIRLGGIAGAKFTDIIRERMTSEFAKREIAPSRLKGFYCMPWVSTNANSDPTWVDSCNQLGAAKKKYFG